MFGVSFTELIIIFAVALVVFGPEKLPEIARKLGKLSAELKKTSDAMRREFYNSVYTPVRDSEERLRLETRSLMIEPSSTSSMPRTVPAIRSPLTPPVQGSQPASAVTDEQTSSAARAPESPPSVPQSTGPSTTTDPEAQ